MSVFEDDIWGTSQDDEQSIITSKIPPGGRKGQMLTKASNKPYDVKWASHNTGADCGCEPLSVIDIIKILEG